MAKAGTRIALDVTRLLGWQVKKDGTAATGVSSVKIGVTKVGFVKQDR